MSSEERTGSVEGVRGWLAERLPSLLEEHGVPGASVAILAGDRVVEAAAGVLNLDTGVEATTDAVFQIGSVTKVFTATLIMQLVDEGRLSLDDPVRRVLPGFRLADGAAAERITIRQLLSHTSGFEGDIFTDTGDGAECLERYVERLADAPQLFPPGELFSYNNAGFCVLGRIVEVLRGEPFDVSMRRRLLDPLGLTRASQTAAEAVLQRAAVGHVPAPRPEAGAPPRESTGGPSPALAVTPVWAMARSNAPAGSMLAMRAVDLVAFARMHLAGGRSGDGSVVLSEAAVDEMRRPQIGLPDIGWGTAWGLGWELTRAPRGAEAGPDGAEPPAVPDLIGHDGNTIGQSAILRVVPERGLALAVLTNAGAAGPLCAEVAGRILSEFAGIVPAEAPRPGTEPEVDRPERYAGRYGSSTVEFDVRVAGDGSLHLRRSPLGELADLGEPVFESRLVPWRGEALIPVEPEDGAHRPLAFVGVDGAGAFRYLHSGRADRRVGA
ncbi:class A beta-lactamase-related serine hydrolase [Leucobacter zeae]|nr:class A beta-lactamase-related serine hydrolase [Leucobacter zeae]